LIHKHKRYAQVLAGVATLSMVAAACGSSSSKSATPSTKAPSSNTTTGPVPTGGTLTVGAEQEPDCMDWVGSCAGSSWGYWMAQVTTMPSALIPLKQADGSYKYEPGPVLSGMPTLKTTPVQTITYNINPKAVWSDGVPITCDDFKYTWQQIATGKNIYDPTGYTGIANVDCTNEAQPVVTYKQGQTYSGWMQLFSAAYGIMPSHILSKGDRDTEMKNGYDWSGGPWFAKWTKGDNITLTPNTKYWGPKPKLDKVVFKIEADTAAEFQAFKSNQVQALYPQPQVDVISAITSGSLPAGAHSIASAQTGAVEALWIQNGKAPFNDKAVRQAVAYSIDRDAIVKQLFGGLGVNKAINSLNPFVLADYSDQNAFSNYKPDPAKVKSLMTGDGYTMQGGFWTKNGQKASFAISTTEQNKRRQLTLEALQGELKGAGFDVSLRFRSAADLFGKDGPNGDFQMALYAQQVTAIVPGLCAQFCTKNIPTAANNQTGNNWQRYSSPAADKQLQIVDDSLDPAAQMAAAKSGDDILAADMASLPIDPLPDILLWSKNVVGPVSDNAIMGMFWNIDQWGCTGGSCS
jgi:peptide/nickel transport system substrate-binding protein